MPDPYELARRIHNGNVPLTWTPLLAEARIVASALLDATAKHTSTAYIVDFDQSVPPSATHVVLPIAAVDMLKAHIAKAEVLLNAATRMSNAGTSCDRTSPCPPKCGHEDALRDLDNALAAYGVTQ